MPNSILLLEASRDNRPKSSTSDHSRVMELGLVDGSEIAVNYQMSFVHKAYQEDVYSATGSLRTCTAVHVGQVLSTNGLQHVRLPSDSVRVLQGPPPPPLLRDLWQLLMLIPTQADMLQQSVERMCMDKESEEIRRPPPTVSSTRRGPRSCRAHRPRRGPPICCSADHR